MALINRLAGVDEDKLPVHQFYATLFEFARGEVNQQQVIDYWGLDADEQTELAWLVAQYSAATNKQEYLERLHCVLMLAEAGVPGYDSQASLAAKLTA